MDLTPAAGSGLGFSPRPNIGHRRQGDFLPGPGGCVPQTSGAIIHLVKAYTISILSISSKPVRASDS